MELLDFEDTIFVRSLFQCVVLTIWNVCIRKDRLTFGKTKIQALVFAQAMSSSVMLFATLGCLRYLHLGDAMTILFSSPIYTGIYF